MTTAAPSAKGFLIRLAAEGIAPLVGGCAGAVIGGPAGAVAGGVLGKVAEEAVKYFGPGIVSSWLGWLQRQPPALQAAAVEQIGNLTPGEARQAAEQALDEVAPDASPEDRAVALEYLAAIPAAVRRSLVTDRARGSLSVPATMGLANGRQLLGLLPTSVPPYRPGSDLPGTPYHLTDLIGSGGFGAVYRATTPTLQHLSFAIKFCLDPSLLDALKRERANLDRLQSAQASGRGSEKIVRLYGYDFDHRTPYLVYEFVPGSDLAAVLTAKRDPSGKGMPPDEALALVTQITEALAFAHERGLVHRDLKPANVLASGGSIKLTDFGIGSVTAAHAAGNTRIGSTPMDRLEAGEQATLFRGAGTALYMSPEQRRGEPADPRHDLYSLGVMWYQLLVGDVSRELHPGWADELLEDHATPPEHVVILRSCVGVLKKRPETAGKLLTMLRENTAPAPMALPVPAAAVEKPVTERAPAQTDTPQAQREELVRAVIHAEDARAKDWRFGLMLAGILVSSILSVPLLVFIIVLSSKTVQRSDFIILAVLSVIFGVIVVGFAVTAVLSGRARRRHKRAARGQLAAVVGATQSALSLTAVKVDPDNHETLCQAGWDLAREIEDRFLTRTSTARVLHAGAWGLDFTVRVFLDGHHLGEGGKRRGFDLPARLCRGTHYLELKCGDQKWRRAFVIAREGIDYRIVVGSLSAVSLPVDVVAAH